MKKRFQTSLLLIISILSSFLGLWSVSKPILMPSKEIIIPKQEKQESPILDKLVNFIVGQKKNEFFAPKYDDEFIWREQCEIESNEENNHNDKSKSYYWWAGCRWDPKKEVTDFWIKNYYWKLLDAEIFEFNKACPFHYIGIFGKLQLEFKNKESSERSTDNVTDIFLSIKKEARKRTSLIVERGEFQVWEMIEGKPIKHNFFLNLNQEFSKRFYRWNSYLLLDDSFYNDSKYFFPSQLWLTFHKNWDWRKWGFSKEPVSYPSKSDLDPTFRGLDTYPHGFVKAWIRFSSFFKDENDLDRLVVFQNHLKSYHSLNLALANDKRLSSVSVTYYFQFNSYLSTNIGGWGCYMIYEINDDEKSSHTFDLYPELDAPIKNPYRNDGKWVLD